MRSIDFNPKIKQRLWIRQIDAPKLDGLDGVLHLITILILFIKLNANRNAKGLISVNRSWFFFYYLFACAFMDD